MSQAAIEAAGRVNTCILNEVKKGNLPEDGLSIPVFCQRCRTSVDAGTQFSEGHFTCGLREIAKRKKWSEKRLG